MSLTHIQTIELGSSQANITFNSVPQDYDDLVLFMSCRSDQSGAYDNSNTRINDSGASRVILQGTGSSVTSSAGPDITLQWPAASATSNIFSNYSFYIFNYTASGIKKSISISGVTENNSTSAIQLLAAILTDTTAAVTTIVVDAPGGSGNFVSGSSISMYGITAGGDGTVTTS